MNILVFVISTMPAGICYIIYRINSRKRIELFMQKNGKDLAGINDFIQFVSFYKTIKSNTVVSKSDLKLMRTSFLQLLITLVTVITWIVLILFFPSIVFGD